jgi:penicillin amidase
LIAILAVVILVGGALAVNAIRSPYPQTEGEIMVPGLEAEVEILRDEFGIPHIYAENTNDLFFTQGFVHAQDRFWQMEFWRHIGLGRLSEIVGEPMVENDKFIRTMGWNRMAADTLTYYEANEPLFMSYLEAYSAGVNAYIDQNRDKLSVNITILGLVNDPWEIEPWTPLHTVAWGVVMSDNLSGNWDSELARAELARELGEATLDSLFPTYPYDNRPVIAPSPELTTSSTKKPATGPIFVDWSRVNTNIIGEVPSSAFMFGDGKDVGSNSWVVSGEHTGTGMPLLANDPHLSTQMPSIWYEVGLHGAGFNVVGFSFAGVPGVVIGHNDRIAWGVTNAGYDTQDLFIEKLNPNNPNQYEFEGEWRDMQVIDEVIKVNGGEDFVLPVRITHHGPIINEVVGDPEDPEDDLQDVLAMKWTAHEPSRVLVSIMLLNQAQNYDEFREATRFFDVPAQNFIYADVDGNIAYQLPGLVPIRKNGDGLQPVPGWTGEYEWEGWVPFEELPAVLNPPKGYIVTANNAVVDRDYPYFLEHYWAPGERAQRIDDLLTEVIDQRPVTMDDFSRIQFDNKSMMSDSYLPLFSGLASEDPQIQAAIERLRGWDGHTNRDSVPAALFEMFYLNLVETTLGDETGHSLEAENIDIFGSPVLFHELARQPDAIWWDDVNTSKKETQQDIILIALSNTVNWFKSELGGNMNNWSWGKIHTATFVSDPLGQSGIIPIEMLVNRGPFPTDGTYNAVNANSWGWDDPAKMGSNPSMRMIVDMSALDTSLAINPTGQSGHPYHPHYDDLIQRWIDGEYHLMHFSRVAVETVSEQILTLLPAP